MHATAVKAQARAQLAAAQEGKNSAADADRRGGGGGWMGARARRSTQQVAVAKANSDLANGPRGRAAEVALAQAQLNLSYTKVVAPEDGHISRLVAFGAHRPAGAAVEQTINQRASGPRRTWSPTSRKRRWATCSPGQMAEIEIDALPGRKVHAKVESVAGGTAGSSHCSRGQRDRQLREGRAAGSRAHRVDEPTHRRGFAGGPVRRRHRRRAKVAAMHNGIRSCAALAALVATTAVANAASRTLTIDEAVALALRSNPQLAAARARAEAGETLATSTGRRMLPSIHLSDEAQYWNGPFALPVLSMGTFTVRDQKTNTFAAAAAQPLVGLLRTKRRTSRAGRAKRSGARAGGRRRVRPAGHRRDPVPARVRGAGDGQDIAAASIRELGDQVTVAKARLAQRRHHERRPAADRGRRRERAAAGAGGAQPGADRARPAASALSALRRATPPSSRWWSRPNG